MKKYIFEILAGACSVLALQSCQKDLQDELNDGKWNHERQVIDITFENQVGKATIETVDAVSGDIDIAINVNAVPDLSQIKLAALQLSYQATSDIKPGDALNFENPERSASITVTATTGETRKYTIRASEFSETLEGVYDVEDLWLYGGTGATYGGSAVMKFTAKSWCWNKTDGPAAENDNVLTFVMTGVTDDGNTYGTCVNDPGPDGKYSDFIYVGNNPEGNGNVDLNHFYRQIPVGESNWSRDYAAGTVTFTDKNGRKTTGAFVDAGTEDLGDGKSFTVENNAFSFVLSGTDDWTNIYSDYDKFVKKPRKYWVTVKKR